MRNAESKISLAKIKKIMQANKEIGKIAHTTPLAIARSLEFFLEDIVELSSEKVREHSESTGTTQNLKISASHVRDVVEKNDKFSFLKEVVQNVPTLDEIDKRKRIVKKTMTPRIGKRAPETRDELDHDRETKRVREE